VELIAVKIVMTEEWEAGTVQEEVVVQQGGVVMEVLVEMEEDQIITELVVVAVAFL
jgi:hypothetical protein